MVTSNTIKFVKCEILLFFDGQCHRKLVKKAKLFVCIRTNVAEYQVRCRIMHTYVLVATLQVQIFLLRKDHLLSSKY